MTATPPSVERETWLRERAALLVREKAHTREGSAIAAARRRLPMVEVDAGVSLIGPGGSTGLLDIFVCVTCFDGGGHPWILLSWPTHSGVRSRSLRTLPVEVRGSWPTKSTDLGALNFAMCSLTCTINSA